MTTYLGIDESNHGKTPEIIVGVTSKDYRDLVEGEERLAKRRSNHPEIGDLLGKRRFKYVLFSAEAAGLCGSDEIIKTIGVLELLRGFPSVNHVVMDGLLDQRYIEEIARELYPREIPETGAEPQADVRYPLVNLADRIANILHRHYTRFKNPEDARKHLRYLRTPRMEQYYPLIERLG